MSSVLHVELQVKDGADEAVRLLRPVDAPAFRLVVEFSRQEQLLRWAASDLHQQVWPQIEAHCSSYTPNRFEETEG